MFAPRQKLLSAQLCAITSLCKDGIRLALALVGLLVLGAAMEISVW